MTMQWKGKDSPHALGSGYISHILKLVNLIANFRLRLILIRLTIGLDMDLGSIMTLVIKKREQREVRFELCSV